jgi:thioredoxin-related protein
MSRLQKRIELIANVSIIVVAIVIGVAVGKRFLTKPSGPPAGIAAGTRINLPNEDWAGNGRTLLLALSTSCKYCSASAGFYHRLLASAPSKIRFVAVFPQSPEESKKYLNSLEVTIEDVKQISPSSIGVRGTPTLILVNSEGSVINSWVGLLSPEKEAEVLAVVR